MSGCVDETGAGRFQKTAWDKGVVAGSRLYAAWRAKYKKNVLSRQAEGQMNDRNLGCHFDAVRSPFR